MGAENQVTRPLCSMTRMLSLKRRSSGMTLLETLVAVAMLVVFTGVVAMVMQFTIRFFSSAELTGERNEFNVSNGVLIDHQQLYIAMDSIVEVLVQPGISLARFEGKERCAFGAALSNCLPCPDNAGESCHPQIAFNPQVDPSLACKSRPVAQWNLSPLMTEVMLPPGYRLCLWATTQPETGMNADGEYIAGIYHLQALPEQLSDSNLPTRRLFCRPRPFC